MTPFVMTVVMSVVAFFPVMSMVRSVTQGRV
jgi:hypothetical protein